MKLVSVNVGRPKLVMGSGGPVSTAIYKEPVAGRVKVGKLNLEGDRQADLSVHGGPTKAIYVYPSEHYEFWRQELPEMELPWGMFGENLTTTGLQETRVRIGDIFRLGSALLMVTEPRMPCYKLGIRFGRSDIIKRFLVSERTGFYLAVLEEGEVGTGDEIELIEADKHDLKVVDVTRLYARDKQNTELLHRALAVEALPQSWKEHFRKQLEKVSHPTTNEN